MAKNDIINIFKYPQYNTLKENAEIIAKLRTRCKIDNKTSEEWSKTFNNLNCHCSNSIEKASQRRQDQSACDGIYGPIAGFPSGSWWGIRMDCSRDRVHIPFDRDIHEGPFGVTSICTPHVNTNNDIDEGTFLTFTGAEYTPGKPRDPLYRNYQNNIPVRVVRSYNLANKFAPQTGYRYDGLYTIVAAWETVLLDSKELQKYALARLNCQEPSPWSLPSTTPICQSKTVSCGASRCRKYEEQLETSEKKRKTSNLEASIHNSVREFQKSARITMPESTIVMRHVSKRDGPVSHGIGRADSPIQSANIACSPKIPPCKLQTTNIAIRTDLYDSSPNHLQHIKRSTPMTFCRMYSTSRTPAKPLNQISLNASRLDETSKDYLSRSMDTECREKICSSHAVATRSISTRNSTPKATYVDDSSGFRGFESRKRFKDASGVLKNSESSLEGLPADKMQSRRNSVSSISSSDSAIKKLDLPEAVVAIEAMSPEQMLNLIVKKRYNPTGKLLIGSIIGLPPDDLSLESEMESRDNNNTLEDIHENESVDIEDENMSNIEENDGFSASKTEKIANKNNQVHLNTSTVVKSYSRTTVPKKRRSELANLEIDANFVTNFRHGMPQTRKTSGRQLRCSTIIINQRRELSGFITNYTRFDLAKNSKRRGEVKTSSSGKKKKISKVNPEPIVNGDEVKNVFLDKTKPKKPEKNTPGMIDVGVQCNFRKDASTFVDMAAQTVSTTSEDFAEAEEEDSESDESDSDSIPEIIYEKNVRLQAASEQPSRGPENERHLSAFAPVNSQETDFRIARLRMIGFKPISEMDFHDGSGKLLNCPAGTSKRDVNERYNIYANEENDIVEYLDDELHYEDLEKEVSTVQKFKSIIKNRNYSDVLSLNTKAGSSSDGYRQQALRKRH